MKKRRQRIRKFKLYDCIIYAARGSSAARRIARALGCRRWRDDLPERYIRRRPYFRGNSSPMVVNWGSTRPAAWLTDPRFRLSPKWINSAEAVERAIDKRQFFKALAGRDDIRILRATTDRGEAEKWLKKGHKVVSRRNLTGSGGVGIIITEPAGKLPEAPLYTRYYPKTHEFRAHIWNGKLIDFTQKKLRGGPNAAANRTVRTLGNGWVHAHENLDLTTGDIASLGNNAILCVAALGLYFGSVDILAILTPERKLKDYRICEVNTGPGLENTETIRAYANAILETKIQSTRTRIA